MLTASGGNCPFSPFVFCPWTFRPVTYLTFPAYSVKTQAPGGKTSMG